MAAPSKIKLNKEKQSLDLEWYNSKIVSYPLKFLRDESPDATNKGETILWKHYAPPPKGPDKPGKYEVKKIELVGNYAIQITWKDGYDHGIYSWELLEKWIEFLELKNNLSENITNVES
ncbi:MAG: DUF971 domain-containing protein [Melioribacteraceae bacterium]|nr:DUF971 domain-containing protein [Melioribacteraceae bacterium]